MSKIEKARLEAALGVNMPTAAELVRREDYKTELEYLSALADMAVKLENPDVKRALRQSGRASVDEQEADVRAKQREEYARIRAEVQLDQLDEAEINHEATRRAREDMASGKIQFSGMGEAIERYGKELTEQRKDAKASQQQFNEYLRSTVKKG